MFTTETGDAPTRAAVSGKRLALLGDVDHVGPAKSGGGQRPKLPSQELKRAMQLS